MPSGCYRIICTGTPTIETVPFGQGLLVGLDTKQSRSNRESHQVRQLGPVISG